MILFYIGLVTLCISLFIGARLLWVRHHLNRFLDAYSRISYLDDDPGLLEDIANKVLLYVFHFWNWDFSSIITDKGKYNWVLNTYEKLSGD